MLFDEIDLKVFNDEKSKIYFQEILKLYYGTNYRAAIVELHSFVTYDLLQKIKTLSNDGNREAEEKYENIIKKIDNNDTYSSIEKDVKKFFAKNYINFYNNFKDELEYLKQLRNRCAHLNTRDEDIFIPSDSNVKTLIFHMYKEVFSVKAPFISNLFHFVKEDIKKYRVCKNNLLIRHESIKKEIKEKYLSRMDYYTIKKNIKNFLKFTFILDKSDFIDNRPGLFLYLYTMIEFQIKDKGDISIFEDKSVQEIISKIDPNKKIDDRIWMLCELYHSFSIIKTIFNANKLFESIKNQIKYKINLFIEYGDDFFDKDEFYNELKQNDSLNDSAYIEQLYDHIKELKEFNLFEFLEIMMKNVRTYNAFYLADKFMYFLRTKLEELDKSQKEKLLQIYDNNSQFYNRINGPSERNELIDSINKN
ncbi:hypothetical protein [Mycoplasma sp. CSL10166]|uniref:hypothetical protein n=1 Tax=Mycoplasma sp. CSL10166 TaxID=2813825 RepID=UPI00197BDAE4|nr:hypothetical protein [Mycoplasma sp. CSL10166]MBN4084251.1 hypothetical protein [Mycoplasma sp. CSL10166]